MKTIYWRFDDLHFARRGKRISSLSIQKKLVSVLDKYRFKATFGLITRYDDYGYSSNKPYLNFIKKLHKNGHEIAAHGLYHNSWKKYSRRELSGVVREMRTDFDSIGIKTRTFIFPGLQTNWKALPVLRKHGFDIIIKGERFNFLKRPYIIAKNMYYRKRYSINFFIPHSLSTEKSFTPPVLDLPKTFKGSTIHVMDHIWLYKDKDISKFREMASRLKHYEWKTIEQGVNQPIPWK